MQTIIKSILGAACAVLLLAGCGTPAGEVYTGSSAIPDMSPAPASAAGTGTYTPVPAGGDSDLLRPGDIVTLTLAGVPQGEEFRSESRVSDDGSITMPRLPPIQAAGMTSSQVQADVQNAYRSRGIYSNPTVTIVPSSRFINVGGEVRSPQRIQFTNDLTVLRAVFAAGGFTDYANRRSVRVIRGGRVYIVNARAAAGDPRLDMPLKAGDVIQVDRSIF